MKTVVYDRYINEDGLKVIVLDSWAHFAIDVVREGIELVKLRKADIGEVELNGKRLTLKAEDDFNEVFSRYLSSWK